MPENRLGVIVEVGDWIADPLDAMRKRKVIRIDEHSDGDATLQMADGGCMGLNEVRREYVFLPGEIDGYN